MRITSKNIEYAKYINIYNLINIFLRESKNKKLIKLVFL